MLMACWVSDRCALGQIRRSGALSATLLKVDEPSIARYIIVRPSPNLHSFCHKACLAERSKAPRSGRGSERSVGSNPTARTSFLGGGTLFLRFFIGVLALILYTRLHKFENLN